MDIGLVSDIEEYVKDPDWFNLLMKEQGYPIPDREMLIELLEKLNDGQE